MSEQERQLDVELSKEEVAGLVRGEFAATENPQPALALAAGDSAPVQPEKAGVREALLAIWQDFAIRWSSRLSDRLQCNVDVDVRPLEDSTYGTFILSLGHPSFVQAVASDQLADPLVIELPTKLLFPMINRLLGGSSTSDVIANRPLTILEQQITASLSDDILADLSAAWVHVVPLSPVVTQSEEDPKAVRVVHTGEPVIAISFDVKFGNVRGFVKMALTKRTVDHLVDRLLVPPAPNADSINNTRQVRVSLATTHIDRDELMDIRVGDILTTETAAEADAQLWVGDEPVFRVLPGIHRNRKAVQIRSCE